LSRQTTLARSNPEGDGALWVCAPIEGYASPYGTEDVIGRGDQKRVARGVFEAAKRSVCIWVATGTAPAESAVLRPR